MMRIEGLAGGYDFEVVSQGRSHAEGRVHGVLWLWPALSTDSSIKTGKHADSANFGRASYVGATNVDFWAMTDSGPRDESTLRARTDPIYPEVLVTSDHGIWEGKPWQEMEMWIGSLSNARDGTIGLDGAGFNMFIRNRDASGFSGTWGPAGFVMTDTGYFCARRMR